MAATKKPAPEVLKSRESADSATTSCNSASPFLTPNLAKISPFIDRLKT